MTVNEPVLGAVDLSTPNVRGAVEHVPTGIRIDLNIEFVGDLSYPTADMEAAIQEVVDLFHRSNEFTSVTSWRRPVPASQEITPTLEPDPEP